MLVFRILKTAYKLQPFENTQTLSNRQTSQLWFAEVPNDV